MKKIWQYFIRGLLFFIPLAVTAYLLWILFIKIDRLLGIPIRGVGFLATIVLITFLGLLASNIFTKSILNFIERIFQKVPFVKLVYNSLKDLIGAFVGEKKALSRPVLVTLFKGSDAKALGFITRDNLSFPGLENYVAVYLPQSYNFAGQVLLVPKEHVQPIKASAPEVMTFIVSAGIASRNTPSNQT